MAATGRGPLLALFVLFADSAAVAELFRMVRWHGGVFCPDCGLNNVAKYCLYQKHLQRYTCNDCRKTFNDKTGTVLHYRHVSLGNWMLALWLFLCGPPLNGVSIRFISQATGQAYKTTYYMMRGIMGRIRGLPEKPLKGACETDEAYVKAGSKGGGAGYQRRGPEFPAAAACPAGPAAARLRRTCRWSPYTFSGPQKTSRILR